MVHVISRWQSWYTKHQLNWLFFFFMPWSWHLVVYINVHWLTEECFFVYFISVLKCQVLMFVFHPYLDVASITSGEECCYFFVIRTYLDGVVFTRFWAAHGGTAGWQLDWLCSSHVIYSWQDLIEWPCLIFPPHVQLIFYIFHQEGFCERVVLGKVTREPFDHVVMSCCLSGTVFLWVTLSLWIQFSSCFNKFV